MKKLIKLVFFDIILLYKNFIRWNLSKMLISLFSLLLGVVLSLPFFILALIIAFFSNIEWLSVVSSILSNNTLAIDVIFAHPFLFSIVALFFIFGALSILFGASYGVILLYKLNFNYLKGKNDIFLKGKYFNFKKIWTYFKLILLNVLVFFSGFIVYLLLMFIITFLFGGVESVIGSLGAGGITVYTVLSFIVTALFLFMLLYVAYRLVFGFVLLAENKKSKKAIDYLKESIKITSSKKSLSRFLVIFILFIIISLPFGYLGEGLEKKYYDMKNYTAYNFSSQEIKDGLLLGDNGYYYSSLEIEYGNTPEETLNSDINYYYYLQRFYFIFSFLFIYGVSHMFLVSFYKRELKGNSNKSPNIIGRIISGIKKRKEEV